MINVGDIVANSGEVRNQATDFDEFHGITLMNEYAIDSRGALMVAENCIHDNKELVVHNHVPSLHRQTKSLVFVSLLI